MQLQLQHSKLHHGPEAMATPSGRWPWLISLQSMVGKKHPTLMVNLFSFFSHYHKKLWRLERPHLVQSCPCQEKGGSRTAKTALDLNSAMETVLVDGSGGGYLQIGPIPLSRKAAMWHCWFMWCLWTWDITTSCTAQGGGGSFKDRKLSERWVVVMHGWQSEPADGPKGGCGFWSGCSGHLTHNCRM